ncbi:MAG: endopeptidase La, partial [Gammaproteobacteria bacterium]|nr:endopeptidase La [Gammaproteobacteria bacterium]
EIAYGYILSKAETFGAAPAFFENSFIHLHVPAGATPKDGPSAGITMAAALLSLALDKPVRRIAMTGELTLTGHVFPVGGIREKMIAARRAGIKELILPEENHSEYDEVPEHIRKGIKVHFVRNFVDLPALLFAHR